MMTSAQSHLDSEGLASAAHEALRAGEVDRARALFADAARAEVEAFEAVPKDKPRTSGILAVSAMALWFKAEKFDRAEQFADRALAVDILPSFAKRELREMLKATRRAGTA